MINETRVLEKWKCRLMKIDSGIKDWKCPPMERNLAYDTQLLCECVIDLVTRVETRKDAGSYFLFFPIFAN
jgi:hypothetical protein